MLPSFMMLKPKKDKTLFSLEHYDYSFTAKAAISKNRTALATIMFIYQTKLHTHHYISIPAGFSRVLPLTWECSLNTLKNKNQLS